MNLTNALVSSSDTSNGVSLANITPIVNVMSENVDSNNFSYGGGRGRGGDGADGGCGQDMVMVVVASQIFSVKHALNSVILLDSIIIGLIIHSKMLVSEPLTICLDGETKPGKVFQQGY